MSANPRSGGLPPRAGGRPMAQMSGPQEDVYNTRVVIMRLQRDGRRGRIIFFAVLGLIIAGVAVLLSMHGNRATPSVKAISMNSSMLEFRPLQDLALPPPPQHTVLEIADTESGEVTATRPQRKHHRRMRAAVATATVVGNVAGQEALFSGCNVTPTREGRPVPVMQATTAILKFGR